MKSERQPYLFVATTGGHLAQLAELEQRIAEPGRPCRWVTFDSQQSRSLLAGKETEFIPFIGERDYANVLATLAIARRIITKHKPAAVFSTGSAIAIPFLNIATLLGVPAHYIESAARVEILSLTARVLSLNPRVRLYRQYEPRTPSRWQFAGSVFDAFEAVDETPRPDPDVRRIVVTLGTGLHPFNRLVQNLESIIPPGVEVLWQTGCTPLADGRLSPTAELPAAILDREMAQADAVIGHSGCGTALSALSAGKIPILSPRTARHGELVDDHQREIAVWLSERGLALLREPGTISWHDICKVARVKARSKPNPPRLMLAG